MLATVGVLGLRSQSHAQRCLPPPLHSPNEHKVGHVSADDQTISSTKPETIMRI